MSRPHARTPAGVVEVLRLLLCVFFAGVGFQIGHDAAPHAHALGGLDGAAIGVIVGCGVGYVVGGMLGRSAAAVVDRTEVALRSVSADSLVAGGFGALFGVLVGVSVSWPLFLVPDRLIGGSVFGVVVVLLAYTGWQIGTTKRDGMLAIFGARAGLAPRAVPTAALPRYLDTSVAIDGRILDVVRAGFLHGRMLISSAVLAELQGLADAGDDNRRGRGRRGLTTLEALRREPAVDVEVVDDTHPEVPEVDAKLVRACLDSESALLTLDTNLARVAGLAGVTVLNLHSLALALRPPVAAGDDVDVLLLKPGKEPGQAVGYLDDGTMVVVERARDAIGREVRVRVTSVLTTANGRLVFAHVTAAPIGRRQAADAS